MEDIVNKIESLKEDKPELVITESLIRQYIEDNMDSLVKDIKELLDFREVYRKVDFSGYGE